MNKNILCILVVSFIATNIFSQNIPQNTSYTRIYDFLDELANDGIIEINSAIKPYSRDFIAQKLKEAQIDSNRLNSRQAAEIHFFLQSFLFLLIVFNFTRFSFFSEFGGFFFSFGFLSLKTF